MIPARAERLAGPKGRWCTILLASRMLALARGYLCRSTREASAADVVVLGRSIVTGLRFDGGERNKSADTSEIGWADYEDDIDADVIIDALEDRYGELWAKTQHGLRRYLNFADHKAFAISPGGHWGYATEYHTLAGAEEVALENCQKHGKACRIVVRDTTVVSPDE